MKKKNLLIGSLILIFIAFSAFAEQIKQLPALVDSYSIKPAVINFAKQGCSPEYPREALKIEAQGALELSILVSKTGKIIDVKVTKSSSHELLDNAVRDTLLNGICEAKPGTRNGEPTESNIKIGYVWKLE